MQSLIKCTVHSQLFKSSNVYEMFGVDFVMDDSFKLAVIEVNASPMIIGTSKDKTALMKKLTGDIIEIQRSLLKSRVKRALKFIKNNSKEIEQEKAGSDKLNELKKQFLNLYSNYWEPEFLDEIKDIKWTKVLDESKENGKERFCGLIEEECWPGLM